MWSPFSAMDCSRYMNYRARGYDLGTINWCFNELATTNYKLRTLFQSLAVVTDEAVNTYFDRTVCSSFSSSNLFHKLNI